MRTMLQNALTLTGRWVCENRCKIARDSAEAYLEVVEGEGCENNFQFL